jgi:putative transposase
MLAFKYRIYPNREQSALLNAMLGDFCQLYNAALEERIGAWKRGVLLSYEDQTAHMPLLRREFPEYGRWSATAELRVLRRLDRSYRAFLGRIKCGCKPGFPRFRSRDRYHAAEFRIGDGLTLRKSGRVGIVGVVGEIKVKWHRDLPKKPKSAIVTRQGSKWYIVFHVEVAATDGALTDSIGIDFGLTNIVALSNGETVRRPNWTKRAAKGLRAKQRAVARAVRGSNRRRKRVEALAEYHRRIANRRRDFCHKLTHDLVSRFGRIAVEDLNVSGLARGILAKHVHDAAWAQIASMLDYKAASAGGQVIKVDPRGTSQTCPECGATAAKTLATREHRCDCGCVLDRDVAAAMVVHSRAFGLWPGTGLQPLSRAMA